MKTKVKTIIIGAGIGGLSAAAELKSKGEKDFIVLESQTKVPMNMQNGLHYLHSTDFGTPFPFKYKSNPIVEEIWDTRTNEFKKHATIPEIMEYSKKIGESKRHPCSIMDPGKLKEVFVPENDDMNSLINAYVDYI
jgi:cation diffusion facilitator CzcD-associated flavoprotein CzcO